MKTTLLKKVRKNYRILRNDLGNDLGNEKIQEKYWLFGFQNIDDWTNFMIWQHNDNVRDAFIDLLGMNYSKYRRKSKIRKQKQNNWKVIWWKS